MGDKYGMDGLKGVASEKFATALKQVEMPVTGAFLIQQRFLCKIIKHVYTSTPDSDKGLRDHVLAYTKTRLKSLLALGEFKKVLAEVPEFSFQLLVQEVSKVSSESVDPKEPSKKRKSALLKDMKSWSDTSDDS